MRKYNHLTYNDRTIIERMCKDNFKKKEIARVLGKSPATISNEIKRNSHNGIYDAQKANKKYFIRLAQRPTNTKINDNVVIEIKDLLKNKFSPETISHKMTSAKLSHQCIYNYIYKDKAEGGVLFKRLFLQKKKRKKYAKADHRGQIKNRISIDERPEIVDLKLRYGDWEGDLIIGKNHKSAMLVLVERKSKVVRIRKLSGKNAKEVSRKIISSLRHFKVKTLTVDNGKEFANHEEIAKALGIKVYFCHPYSSWERGLSENTNRLVRQYFPKGKDFRKVSRSTVWKVEQELNNRPQKLLNWKSPNDYKKHLQTA